MTKIKETPETLAAMRQYFDLNEVTWELIWKHRTGHSSGDKKFNARRAGKPAGYLNDQGYLRVEISGSTYAVHRIIYALRQGRWPLGDVDHKDGCRTNNHPDNLREASRSENLRNSRGHRDSRSGIKGVSFFSSRKRWVAEIMIDGKRKRLGYFLTADEAKNAYQAAARELHGEFIHSSLKG